MPPQNSTPQPQAPPPPGLATLAPNLLALLQQQGAQGQQHQPQGQGPQGHLGYSQGSSDGSFYPYQPRQGAYWQ